MLRSSASHPSSYFAADFAGKAAPRADLLDKLAFESAFDVQGSTAARMPPRETFFGSMASEASRGGPSALDRMPSSSKVYSAKMETSAGPSVPFPPTLPQEAPRLDREDARRTSSRDEIGSCAPMERTPSAPRSVVVEEQDETVEFEDAKNASDRESDINGSDAMNGPMLIPFQTFNNKINEVVEEWFQTATKFAEGFDQHRQALTLIASRATQEMNGIKRKRRIAFSAMEELRAKILKQSAATDADNEQGEEVQDEAEEDEADAEELAERKR